MSAAENPYAGQGAVLLDIGGDIGALVVTMPQELVGREVEIRPEGHRSGHLAHVAVVERPVAGSTVPSLVFGDLRAGRYDLFHKGRPDAVAITVEVEGGQVAAAQWPR